MPNIKHLANPSVANLIPYQPGKPIEELARELGLTNIIKLASNENPLGASPQAVKAAQNALKNIHLYPDGNGYELKQALSKKLNVDMAQITLGDGSENIFDIIVKAFLTSNDAAIVSQYCFATIPIVIKALGAELITVPAINYGHDILSMIAAITDKTRIIFVVNPNNPTGTYNTTDEVVHLLETVPENIIVVLDEAYCEYLKKPDYPASLKLLERYPNLIITRTFSKIYGLAGLRVGYAISHMEIADILNRARLPFNVNLVALTAATAALFDDEHVHKTLELNEKGMLQLEQGLEKLNIKFISSVCNFICIDMEQAALPIYEALLQEGVIVRPLGGYGMSNHLRVTIGTYKENERFLQALSKVLGRNS